MVYCKKCARLLDKDVRFCPYCDSEDDHFVPETEDETANLLKQLDEQIARNNIPPDTCPPAVGEPQKNISHTDPPVPGVTGVPPAPIPQQLEYVDPRDITVEPSSFDPLQSHATAGHAYAAGAAHTADAQPSTGMYVGMILLSVFLTLPGAIVGIVYMTNKNAAYRKMGLIMLLVSIGLTLLWCIACCAMFYVVGNAMITTF